MNVPDKNEEGELLIAPFVSMVDMLAGLALLFMLLTVAFAINLLQETTRARDLDVSLVSATARWTERERQLQQEATSALAAARAAHAELERHREQLIIIPNEMEGRVFFASGSAAIRRDFLPILNHIADEVDMKLRNGEFDRIEINGHTDELRIHRGCYSDNWDLAAARAIAIARFLVNRGVPPSRVTALSHGEFKPAVGGNSERALASNRRIELRLVREERR